MPAESTTPDLVELVRRSFAAAARRDWDAVIRFFAPDAVWDVRELHTFEGLAAIRGLLEDWIGAYGELDMEVEEVLDLGRGVGFVKVRQVGRIAGSTGQVQVRYAAVYVWAGGLISRITSYADIDEARSAAARLAESCG
jgi:ketosteroid isomerase-like protein